MELRPDEITIAITVYNRRDFLCNAIQSALDQTVPVKVIVVEDCGPDPTLRDFVVQRFGNRITYFRNPERRGLCGNWNACMEYCSTPWISILHDDDILLPDFVQSMVQFANSIPGKMLYLNRPAFMDEHGKITSQPAPWLGNWRDIDLQELADECFLFFAGQLFRVADAVAVGGVRPNSIFTGDWDLWFRLALEGGAVQTKQELAVMRYHYTDVRGTSRVERMGWKWALDNIQRKRNLYRLKLKRGIDIPFDRTKLLAKSPIPSRLLLNHAHGFSRGMLRYNAWLFTHSEPPSARYALLQQVVQTLGSWPLRLASKLFRNLNK